MAATPDPVPPPDYGLPFVPDIDFAEKDPAIIVTEVVTDYEAAFKALTGIAKTLAPGDPVRLFLLVVCGWLSQQRTIIDFTGKQNLLKYAAGDYLDNLAALYGQRAIRLPAAPALTTLRFTLVAPLAFNAVIPVGTLCQGPNAVVFQTLKDGLINSGDVNVDVAAMATVAGVLGNGFAPGQIRGVINWNLPYAVTVANTTVSAGGSDPETDEQYRYRVWLAIESFSTCGPHDAYEFWALSAHPDIIQCVVHSAPEIAGEVWLYPLLRGGQLPTPDILAAVEAVCSAKTRRPLTDYVTAKVADTVTFRLDMDYWILKSNEVLQDVIISNVEAAAADWISWTRSAISRDIIGDELARRCLEAGAKRIQINEPSPSYQVMDYNQLAVCDPTGPNADQTFTDGTNTTGTPIVTSPSAKFQSSDVGLSTIGPYIPPNTTVLSVQSPMQMTMSNNSTSGSPPAFVFTIQARIPPVIVNFAGLEEP